MTLGRRVLGAAVFPALSDIDSPCGLDCSCSFKSLNSLPLPSAKCTTGFVVVVVVAAAAAAAAAAVLACSTSFLDLPSKEAAVGGGRTGVRITCRCGERFDANWPSPLLMVCFSFASLVRR